ncbi:TetR/AcrR family transcriptional regulator [Streptomyces sp. NBC_00328]|uniref:TetR/AcrR family transcriptional regulator n=1 Tax=Streptomyces sp. NBC_00328 TaxID=2903646 RepID=UPI002E2975E7|nr:TetR/AcrR family transcriptional regulator [Streptomyces sp. NBC_00328]
MNLPTSIEVAWGLREPVTKGPKRVLSLERIVGTAVTIAEESGLGAVSMNRIAGELNSSTMSLYRYVSAKDELLPLMVDQAFGPPVAPEEECAGWRAGLEHWSWSYLAVLRRHSWVIHVPTGGPPSTPNQVAWTEQGLSFLADVNLREAEKLSTILLLAGIVRNDAMLASTYEAFAKAGASGGEIMMDYRRLIERLADKEHFPAINKAIKAGVFDSADDQDTEFIFALKRVLDGVDVLIRERAQSRA